MNHSTTSDSSGSGWLLPVSAAVALLLIAVAGYFLYLHAGSVLQKGQTLPPLLIVGLALIGGAASFFSPCSIAITPGFLAYLTAGTSPDKNNTRLLPRTLVFAAALVAVGIIVFYVAAGILIGLVGSIVYNYLIYFIPVVGVAFVLLGVLLLLGRSGMLGFFERWNPMNRRYARQEIGTPAAGPPRKRTLISFGFAYGAASHTCSLPIFLGVLMLPLVAGNYPLAVVSVFAYGFAIALLVVVMMLLGQRVFVALRRTGPWLMRLTAVLFIGTGGFLFYYFGQNYGTYVTQAWATSATTTMTGHRYTLTEGADATGYPYQPRTLVIPSGQTVQVAVTDHIGGCLLRTIFEGLGPDGHEAEITVPVGATRVLQLYASHPGRYVFHCGGNMYSGTVLAQRSSATGSIP
ncbi:MAG: cytochrome c biogenesis protein CcdA [Gammaproteobacteria bacterium]